jgi:hypothetical protein
MTETTRPTTLRVIADHTPGPHRTVEVYEGLPAQPVPTSSASVD